MKKKTKKQKQEKKKRKEKEKKGQKFTLRDHQQWQITFITLNNNGFYLFSIYLHWSLTSRLSNQLMDNMI